MSSPPSVPQNLDLPDRTSSSSSPASNSPLIPSAASPSAPLPLTMSASIVLTHLPRDASSALVDAGAFLTPKVTVRLKAVGNAPILKQTVFKISSDQRFEAVVAFLRRRLLGKDVDGAQPAADKTIFCYVNSVFAPGLDEVVGNLHRCFRNQHDDQLVVAYSMTPAFG